MDGPKTPGRSHQRARLHTCPSTSGGQVLRSEPLKVFISHSSQDKWVASRLSQDLVALGVETFLDEKDIQTGESIDDSIQKHLGECDELLMLLSPAALASHWVLLEIGGAKALKKRLVPILLHVGPNDLPAPLSKGLARDLNDIEKYYEEVKQRSTGSVKPARRPAREPLPKTAAAEAAATRRRTFKVGDLVKIPERPQPETPAVTWASAMTAHVGKTATVTDVDDDRTVKLDVSNRWWWAMDWLEPASSA